MNKKIFALLIAFSISATPAAADVSSLLKGYLSGAGSVLCFFGYKKLKGANSYIKVVGNNNNRNEPAAVDVHNWTTDYKNGGSLISTGLLAFIIAALIHNVA